MRIEPAKLPVVKLRMQCNLIARIFENVQTEVRRVRRARRNQTNVNHRTRRPGVSFIDGIAVPIDLQRTIEVRAGLDRAFAVVLDFSAPENRLPFFIGSLQLKPDVECVHSAAGEKMPDLARPYDHIHAGVIASLDCCVGAIDRSRDGADFSRRSFRQRNIRFFANRESRREFRLSHFASRWRIRFFPRRRNRENIHAQLLVLQKVLSELVLCLILIRCGYRSIRSGESMRMHEPVHVAVIARGHLRHVAIRAIHRRLRIVKRARALPGDAAGLPVVVFIEAANPPVTIHRNIQMNLMA